ncbi:conserved hypothetical protein [Hoeflea sp. EC-HK425]|nr:conserved hypothetical protein [Hoeflea sp. EC-HK425]
MIEETKDITLDEMGVRLADECDLRIDLTMLSK